MSEEERQRRLAILLNSPIGEYVGSIAMDAVREALQSVDDSNQNTENGDE